MTKVKHAILILVLSVGPVYAAEYESIASLYSYSGYVATPSAYITDGRLGLHYTYLPNHVAPYKKGRSENWVFSGTLGLLPFMECYFSVFVAPQENISKKIYNYGADKTRSPGVKFQLLREHKRIPALAVGVFDPEVKDIGADFSAANISSVFVVASKQFGVSTFSLGYGSDYLSGTFSRLRNVFGGASVAIRKNILFLADYDSEFISAGLSAQWYGFSLLVASVHGHGPACRFGYQWYLLD